MKDEILEYIRKHVTEWPEGAYNVRLGKDGEICFRTDGGVGILDFYPKNDHMSGDIKQYTREQWQPEINLETIDKPFGKLDRKTQLRLVEHVLDGGSVNVCSENVWYSEDYRDVVCFCSGSIYRAKPSRKD